MHGGRSTGPKTVAGREKCGQANLRHGRYTQEYRQCQKELRAFIAYERAELSILEREVKRYLRNNPPLCSLLPDGIQIYPFTVFSGGGESKSVKTNTDPMQSGATGETYRNSVKGGGVRELKAVTTTWGPLVIATERTEGPESEWVQILLNLEAGYIEHYDKENPYWFDETKHQLAKQGFEQLRRMIEDPQEPNVSWENPWGEGQYEIEWDWDAHTSPIAGRLEEASLTDLGYRQKKLAEIFIHYKRLTVFQECTMGAALLKGNGNIRLLLSEAASGKVEQLPEDEKKTYLSELYRPHTLEEKTGRYPRVVLRDENLLPTTASFVVCFFPLIVDEDHRRAYYPVQSRIIIDPKPTDWTASDFEQIWQAAALVFPTTTDHHLPGPVSSPVRTHLPPSYAWHPLRGLKL